MELPTPRPADLPLPGGSAGAAVRVHPLRTARMKAMPDFWERPAGRFGLVRGLGLHVPRSRWKWLPIPAFLIEHPTAGPILVDTGLHEQVATDVAGALGRPAQVLFTIDMKPEWAVPHQLRARGVDPASIETVVMTHLHYDHASGLTQFPQATVLVDEREWSLAKKGRITDGYMTRLFPAANDWRLLPGEVEEIDLLGDGSIRLLSTPGHTPGHRSVILRLAGDRELLLTADAAYARRTLDDGLTPLLTWDDDAYRASLAKLQAWVAAHPGAPVVTGHDLDELWAQQPAVYE
jgi:glyoxylase-like metal-dependent hydrolase (beta-lactamase superfamily II)